VLSAIRELDVEYDLRSFMRDFTQIREQTFKESTILYAFQKARIWPISCTTALKKLRTYSQPTSTPINLPLRPSTPKPSTFKGVEEGLQRWKERVPAGLSSHSKESYENWLTGTEEVVAAGQLQELDLQAIRWRVEESKKRASRSRARLQAGGELTAAYAYELRA
jgi:hypothetical protein